MDSAGFKSQTAANGRKYPLAYANLVVGLFFLQLFVIALRLTLEHGELDSLSVFSAINSGSLALWLRTMARRRDLASTTLQGSPAGISMVTLHAGSWAQASRSLKLEAWRPFQYSWRSGLSTLLLGFGLTIGLITLIETLAAWAHFQLPPWLALSFDPAGILAVLALAPVLETFLFAWIVHLASRAFSKSSSAACVAGLFFGGLHWFNGWQYAVAVVPGFAVDGFAFLQLRSAGHSLKRRLLYLMAIHAAHNGLALLFVAAGLRG
ncbi:CPBP family intramembrane glutamic endopeptidase [Pelomonas sp. SE-A7]|uniref:CPBP family intramembrane glutamic endopeptidase n=1 Tax=Pelomonas sp. SE-A7 TaxID=3054953 RepID=UPI00259CF7FD|nr:CPBP family intramembrane glutamic endopeptidase [Pelomonas sp. SE-A7]MDM4767945.1 CPBP family intramembrane metalloprotease [Pelomonas sp. SE-A7]